MQKREQLELALKKRKLSKIFDLFKFVTEKAFKKPCETVKTVKFTDNFKQQFSFEFAHVEDCQP